MTYSVPKEEDAQIMLYEYIRLQYPGVIAFHIKAGQLLAPVYYLRKLKRMGVRKSIPDFFISEPRDGYHGLYIELKREGTRLTKKDGNWVNTHIEQQHMMIERLRNRGYRAEFAIGFDEAKRLVDSYLQFAGKAHATGETKAVS